jgi:GH15 family glucan-1,4-alpha-glucosidase
MTTREAYQPIENYGVVGNLHTVALVGMDGSIDFLCLPQFDSPSVFAALLDARKGGYFQIRPASDGFRSRQRYVPSTNLLETVFLSDDGVAEIVDFMTLRELGHDHELVRHVTAVKGDITFRLCCAPAFNYARDGHTVQRHGNDLIFSSKGGGQPALRLRSDIPLRYEQGAATAEFVLKPGETASFILEVHTPEQVRQGSVKTYVLQAMEETTNFWLKWSAQSKYRGPWREMVNRSALTLKLLISQPNGAMVAAPTFGLPGQIGGSRNWDYRYTWVRDSCFTIDALMRLGYTSEAGAFGKWIEERCKHLKSPQPLHTMYRTDGGSDLEERELPNLEGYRKSSPVRIGNAAYKQLQLDIYGELLDAVSIYQGQGKEISHDFWEQLARLIEWVNKNWKRSDKSIWEIRSASRPFLYSRVMSWVALDRGIKLARQQSLPAPLVRWQKTRDLIYRDVHQHFWNSSLKTFVQTRSGSSVDASTLLLPRMKFISATDPRWVSTLQAIESALSQGALLFRYNGASATHLKSGPRGSFTMCSFWWVECMACAGQLRKAETIFEKMLGYANHLGLYAEQIGPAGHHQGNFPQGLSHSGLISAACVLNEQLETQQGDGEPRG